LENLALRQKPTILIGLPFSSRYSTRSGGMGSSSSSAGTTGGGIGGSSGLGSQICTGSAWFLRAHFKPLVPIPMGAQDSFVFSFEGI